MKVVRDEEYEVTLRCSHFSYDEKYKYFSIVCNGYEFEANQELVTGMSQLGYRYEPEHGDVVRAMSCTWVFVTLEGTKPVWHCIEGQRLGQTMQTSQFTSDQLEGAVNGQDREYHPGTQ